MNHPLQQAVRQAGRYSRRMALIYALASTILVGGLTLLLGVTLDWYFRWDALRYAAFFLLIGIICFAIGRWIWPVLPFHRWNQNDDLRIARWIERRQPGFRDRLSTAVEQLSRGTSASASMRSTLIDDAHRQLAKLSLPSLIDRRKINTCLALTVTLLAVAVLVGSLFPSRSQAALRRVFAPWAAVDWPTRNHLVFENPPEKMAIGAGLDFLVEDKNRNRPSAVELQIRFSDEAEILRFAMVPGERSGNVFNLHLTGLTRSFEYRAEGGDDRTDWHDVEVVAGPHVTNIQISCQPPNYAQLNRTEGSGSVKVLAGSKLTIKGSTDLPVKTATLCLDVDGNVTRVPLSVGSKRRNL